MMEITDPQFLMKAATLLGVAVSAIGANWQRLDGREQTSCLILAGAGALLMIGNAEIAARPFGLALDIAYLAAASVPVARHLVYEALEYGGERHTGPVGPRRR
jgi:hypothetical protein